MVNKISLVILMACLCFIGVFSLVIAASNESEDQGQMPNETKKNETQGGIGLGVVNKTFLQCVSDAAAVKNTCFSTSKDTYSNCRQTALNASDRQGAQKCLSDYKKVSKDCKSEFKAQRIKCHELKHNWFESLRSNFM